MAEQQALLERTIEAAAHSDSGNVTHKQIDSLSLVNPLSNVMLYNVAEE